MAESQQRFLQIPPSGIEDLLALAEYADQLGGIISAAESAGRIDFDSICESVCDKLSIKRSALRDVLDGLATLRNLADKMGIDETLRSVTMSLIAQAPPSWKEPQLRKWNESLPAIENALKSISPDSPISLRQKITQLTYAHQNILTESRLITDVRPIYSAAGDKILAMVLTHVFSLEYFDGSNPKRIDLALDAADLAKLRSMIERAQRKVATARETFDGSKFHLIVAGVSTAEEA